MNAASTAQPVQSRALTKFIVIIIVGVFIGACYLLWQAWPTIIIRSMQWQKEINSQLSELLFAAKSHSLEAGVSLAGLSFLYGLLHSLGPGHGKLIVTTYIATHSTKVRLSLVLTLLSAIMQALVAVALVSALLLLFDSSMRDVNSKAELFITLSFYTVVLLGLIILWRNLSALWQWSRHKRVGSVSKSTITAVMPIPDQSYSPVFQSMTMPERRGLGTCKHTSEGCGCGHQHVVDPKQINSASSLKEYLAIIFSIGIRPCTGAIMVLLFANMLDIYWLGIISAFIMALGTAFTTSIIAVMTISGRQLVKRYLTSRDHQKAAASPNRLRFGPLLLRMIGGILLILMGIVLLSSQPVGMAPML